MTDAKPTSPALRDQILAALRTFGPRQLGWLTCHLFECEYLSRTFFSQHQRVLIEVWALGEAGAILLDRQDPTAPVRLPNQQHARRA